MIEIKEKRYKIIFYICLTILSSIFSVYYYGVSRGVLPCHEELAPLYQADFCLNQGYEFDRENIYYIVCKLVVYLWGVRYGSIRIVWCIFYFCISFFTLDLAIRDNKWNCKIYAVPLYIILMVLVHLSGKYLSVYYGKLSEFDQYPFNNHIQTTLASVLFLWIYYRIQGGSLLKFKKKRSNQLFVLIALIGCYWIAGTPDTFLFLAQTAIPFFMLTGRKYLCDSRSRSILLIFIFGGMGVLNLVIGLNNESVMDLMYRYHFRDIIDIKELFNQILAYIACVSGTFNFDFWAQAIDLKTSTDAIRIIFVLYIFKVIYDNIKNYFKHDDFAASIDLIMCWGIVIVSFFFIWTRLGYWDRARYINIFLPYGTILLCRNIEAFLKFVKIPSIKMYLVISVLFIFLSYNPEWGKHREYNEFDYDLIDINKIVEEKNLHEGLAPRLVYSCVTAQGKGRHKSYPIAYQEQLGQFALFYEMDYSNCFFDYFIIPNGELDGYYFMDHQVKYDGGEGEVIKAIYGEPNEIITFSCYDVFIYYEGIDIEFRQRE